MVDLIRANQDAVAAIREHLAAVLPDYAQAFDRLVESAREQGDE